MNLEYLIYISLILCCLAVDCATRTTAQDMAEPEFVEADRQYADVFKSLDGSWKGTSTVYRKIGGQSKKNTLPTPLDKSYPESLELEIMNQIRVTQHYESSNALLSKGQINDEYQHGDERLFRSLPG